MTTTTTNNGPHCPHCGYSNATTGPGGRCLACDSGHRCDMNTAQCGAMGHAWCAVCEPTPSALCPRCDEGDGPDDDDHGPTTYAVTASRATTGPDGYTGRRHLPMFYLDSSVQGITGPYHAARIAVDIIGPGAMVHVMDLTTGTTAWVGADR